MVLKYVMEKNVMWVYDPIKDFKKQKYIRYEDYLSLMQLVYDFIDGVSELEDD